MNLEYKIQPVSEWSDTTKRIIAENAPKYGQIIKKKLFGILLLFISYFVYFQWFTFIYNNGPEKQISFFLAQYVPFDVAGGIANIMQIIILIGCFLMPLYGLYCLTPGGFISAFGSIGNAGNFTGQYKNIDRVLNYRDAKMGGMNSADAAEYYIETSKLDNVLDDETGGVNTQRAKDYINGRLGGMDNEQGVDYLRGNRD